ncbi:MAG: carboxymuconolactone decarboxylase family protein [Bacteroidia bacterium]
METLVMKETLQAMLQIAGQEMVSKGLETVVNTENKYLRDLKINLGNALQYQTLSKKESYLLALSVAINEKNKLAIESFTKLAMNEGSTEAEIAETYACVSLLNANNVLYRFRHFTKKDVYQNSPAGIKMSIMMSPVFGKEFFELMSLAVSALNGCELCVNAHEASLLKLGTSENRIFDAIKLTAIVRSFTAIQF